MPWSDERMDRAIGALLRVGVLAAAAVVLAGGTWYLIQSGGTASDYHVFRGEPAQLSSVAGVLKGVWRWQPRSLIQLGLLLLIATPVARVVFSVAAFAFERDRTYVVITLIVLIVLIGSFSGLGLRY